MLSHPAVRRKSWLEDAGRISAPLDGSAAAALKIRVSGVRFPLWPFRINSDPSATAATSYPLSGSLPLFVALDTFETSANHCTDVAHCSGPSAPFPPLTITSLCWTYVELNQVTLRARFD